MEPGAVSVLGGASVSVGEGVLWFDLDGWWMDGTDVTCGQVHAHNGVVTPKSTQRKQKPLKTQTKTAFHLPHLRGHSHEIFCCLSSSHTHTHPHTHIGSRISRATERSAAAATARGKQEQRGDAATPRRGAGAGANAVARACTRLCAWRGALWRRC